MMSLEEFIHLVLDDFNEVDDELAEYLADSILDKAKWGEIKELQTRLPQPAQGRE